MHPHLPLVRLLEWYEPAQLFIAPDQSDASPEAWPVRVTVPFILGDGREDDVSVWQCRRVREAEGNAFAIAEIDPSDREGLQRDVMLILQRGEESRDWQSETSANAVPPL